MTETQRKHQTNFKLRKIRSHTHTLLTYPKTLVRTHHNKRTFYAFILFKYTRWLFPSLFLYWHVPFRRCEQQGRTRTTKTD